MRGGITGSTMQLAAVAIMSVFLLLVFPGFSSAAQQADVPEHRITVRLASEGGGTVLNSVLTVERLGTRGEVSAFQRIRVEDGSCELLLQNGQRYRLIVRATGHREASVDFVPERSRALRLVLPVDPFELPPIVASAGSGTPNGPARTVDHVRFSDATLTYATVAEWLDDVPGASVRGRGPGGRQALSVRGSRQGDVLVLLDGAPLNDPITGKADLSTLPTSTLESGTLVRGAASQRYGSGASAGVLLLSSRRAEGTSVGGGLRAGSFGTRGLDAQFDVSGPGARLGISVSAQRAENDFTFEDPFHSDSAPGVRRNADVASVHASAHGAWGPWFGSLRVDGSERGVPGRAGTSVFDSARAEDRAWIAAAGMEGAGGRFSVSRAWRTLGYTASTSEAMSRQDVREFRVAGDLVVPSTPVTVGGRLTSESVSGDDLEGAPGRNLVGARAAATLGTGQVRLDPALSVDVSGGRSIVSPELAVAWNPDSRTRVWARVGQGFRLPTFGDLYFGSQYRLRPNPALEPERINLDAELGVGSGWIAGKLLFSGSVTAWSRRTEQPIVWVSSAVAVWSPQNLDALEARGLEIRFAVEASGSQAWGWRAQLAGALQDSRVGFGSNRNPLPYEPRSTVDLGLEAWRGGLGARVKLRYTGPRTTSLAATRTLEAFAVADLAVRQSVATGPLRLAFYLELENLLDRRYQLVELFPEPGRNLSVRLEARRAYP